MMIPKKQGAFDLAQRKRAARMSHASSGQATDSLTLCRRGILSQIDGAVRYAFWLPCSNFMVEIGHFPSCPLMEIRTP
jgi:hypothetical protein